jgi:ankyrin repeat protein
MIVLLHQFGADPLILNDQNQSSLHIACAANRLSIVQTLFTLTQSYLLEIQDNQGQTALSVTTHAEIIDELLKFDADISSLDHNHMNVLMIAVSKSQRTIIEHLLNAMGNKHTNMCKQVDKRHHRSTFLIAAQTGSVDICSLLLTNSNIHWNTTDRQRMNAFHLAARYNHYELIEFLCQYIQNSDRLLPMKSREHSIELNRTDSQVTSAQQGSLIVRSYLNAQNDDGKTPLHLAAERGHTFSIQTLLKCGVDVLLTNHLGQLALHVTIQNGHTQCAELLIKACRRHMADFNVALSRRQSPLITACQKGYVDIVRMLLAQDIGVKSSMDSTNTDRTNDPANPLEIAIKYRQAETLHVLLEHSNAENWLMSMRQTPTNIHQTPLRDMIRYMPECAKHAFDRLISKSNETDPNHNVVERITYRYKLIDDYIT